ncbi:MAG: hypothetical protein JNK67_15985 [Alphaproteobacteria bacterium]|nr:hypothetical protein [Alphaproteobacteria bacterium]
MIRRSLLATLVAGLAMLISAAPSAAAPIHYDIDFTLSSGSIAPTSGGFDYDGATGVFSNFVVQWNGLTFDMTGSANSPIVLGTIYQTECGVTGAALAFAFLSHAACIDDFAAVDSDVWFAMIPLDFSQPQLFAFDAISFVPGGEISTFATAPYDPTTVPTPAVSRGRWTLTAETTPPAIPAPASLASLAMGIAMLPVVSRRRRRDAD